MRFTKKQILSILRRFKGIPLSDDFFEFVESGLDYYEKPKKKKLPEYGDLRNCCKMYIEMAGLRKKAQSTYDYDQKEKRICNNCKTRITDKLINQHFVIMDLTFAHLGDTGDEL